jgi:hypothetical protein
MIKRSVINKEMKCERLLSLPPETLMPNSLAVESSLAMMKSELVPLNLSSERLEEVWTNVY